MIIRNGKILRSGRFVEGCIKVEAGIITRIDTTISEEPGERVIDAENKYVIPGLIDVHTHLDDFIGRYPLSDDFLSGSTVALKNGITTIFTFITETENRSLRERVEEFLQKGRRSIVNYGFHLTPVRFGVREIDYIRDLIDSGFSSFKFYTTYKNAGIFLSYEEIERIVNLIKRDKTVFLVHCEDESVLEKNYCLDYQSPLDHALLRPVEAEVTAIEKIIDIAKRTDARFHIVHCSTIEGAKLVETHKKHIEISLETCPQYLLLSDDLLKGADGHRYFCTPPLRSSSNASEMQRALKSGLFDIVATDHAPFFKKDKDENKNRLRLVPNGLAGLGALPHIIYSILDGDREERLIFLVRLISENPARIMNLYPKKGVIEEGSDADIVILSEGRDPLQFLPSLSDTYNPYEGFYSKLLFDYVIINGCIVKEGDFVNTTFEGRCLNVRDKGLQK